MKYYAVGLPGQMPRLWVEAGNEADADAQMRDGEVKSDDVTTGTDGRPVPALLPTIS